MAAAVPSGVDAAAGEVEGPAVEASVTSTNHAPKIGLYVGRGARHAGSVRTVDIGIPPGDPGASFAGLTSRRVLQTIAARSRRGSKLEARNRAGRRRRHGTPSALPPWRRWQRCAAAPAGFTWRFRPRPRRS